MRLSGGDCSAVLDPADGGRMTSFLAAGHELLVQDGRDMFHYGNFVLAPWVGRLRDATLRYEKGMYRFPPNDPPNAVHGLVTGRPWKVASDGQLAVELADPWPWSGRVVHSVSLGDGRADFRIEVQADEPMPVAVGWHPWFTRRLVTTDGVFADVVLDVEPGRMYGNDLQGLPTGKLVAPVPPPWDYCFVDLAKPPVLRWPGTLELTVSSELAHWVLYDREDAGVCVEPWTGPPNSLNMPNPSVVRPGQPLVATMTWTWRTIG